MKIKGIYSDHLFVSKFFIFIGLLLGGFGISIILGFLLVEPLFGIDLMNHPEILNSMNGSEEVSALKFMQLMNSLGIFVFPPLVFAYVASSHWTQFLNLNRIPNNAYLLFTFLLVFSSLPLINLMIEFNESMQLPEFLGGIESWMREKEDSAREITESFLEMQGFGDYLMNLLVIGIVPAFGEELLFRGILQKQLTKRTGSHHLGIWIAAFLFSAIHIQFYGFIPRMMLGVLFGYMFVWSGSLWIPILAHLINNGGAVTAQYFLGSEFTEENLDTIGTGSEDWAFLTLSVVLTAYLLYAFWRYRRLQN